MDSLLHLITQYGYPLLALIVFMEAVGFPVPAAPALLAAGAAAAKGILLPWHCLGVALGAMMAGDIVLFCLGRWTGWWLLGLLCRMSINPEACIFASAAQFYKRGRVALLVAKFVPGFNTMAPPIAGSMNMHPLVFLRYDMGGALFYILVYGLLGFTFSEAIGAMTEWLGTLGRAMGFAIGTVLALYIGWRFWRSFRMRKHDTIERVSADDLADLLGENILIADVRSHGYYDVTAVRILSSVRLEPNRLPAALTALPKDQRVYLYCSCHSEATSQRVAEVLRDAGLETRILRGGMNAWKRAGHPMERVPADDVVHLPRFI